jgi:hypothetical protein
VFQMGNNEKKEVSKSALNNIFQPNKPLPRAEARRRYQSLSSEAKEEVNGWVNNRYTFNREVPSHMKNIKLDTNNPQHKKYVEIWLKERDHVLANKSNLDWEKSGRTNYNTSYFSREIAPTPKEVLTKSQGILEQRLDGKGFKKHVTDRLQEATIYSGKIGRRVPERRIALMIATKLFENDVWVQNAGSTREGREALGILSGLIHGFINEGKIELTSKDKEIINKLDKITKPYEGEDSRARIVDKGKNIKAFTEGFPKISAQIQKKLEAQGYQVEKIYYRNFTNNSIEIRANVTKETKIFTPHAPMTTITEKKEMSMGGINTASGRFINSSYFNKHGTAETDWDTQLAIGELAVLAGVGIRAVISGARSVLVKVSKTGVKELGGDVVERSIKDTISDPALGRLTRETVDDLPYARTQRLERTPIQSMTTGEPSLPRVKQPKLSKRESSDTLAPAIVPDQGARWYKNTKRITASLEEGATPRQLQAARARAAARKPGARELREAPSGAHDLHITMRYGDRVPPKEIPRYSEGLTERLGDTPQIRNRNQEIFRKAGFTEQDVNEWMGRLQKKTESMGLDPRNAERAIQSHITTESGLIQHLKNRNGLTWRQVRGELQESAPSGGDVRHAIAELDELARLDKSWTKAKNDYPGIEGTPRGVSLLKDLGRKAHQEAYKDLNDMLNLWERGGLRSLEKRAGVSELSATAAGAVISLTPELRETKKGTESLPKIRENTKQTNEQKKIRENKKPSLKNTKLRANF